jgi:hypothetical protein
VLTIKNGGIVIHRYRLSFFVCLVFFFRGPLGLDSGFTWFPLGKNYSRNKAIIRTHLQQQIAVGVGSDYIGLVREAGLEPARPY